MQFFILNKILHLNAKFLIFEDNMKKNIEILL